MEASSATTIKAITPSKIVTVLLLLGAGGGLWYLSVTITKADTKGQTTRRHKKIALLGHQKLKEADRRFDPIAQKLSGADGKVPLSQSALLDLPVSRSGEGHMVVVVSRCRRKGRCKSVDGVVDEDKPKNYASKEKTPRESGFAKEKRRERE